MKRLLLNNKSGEESYGQKWQNFDSESDDDLHSAAQISGIELAKQQSPTITPHGDDEKPIPKGKRVGIRMEEESMYLATLQGDWIAAEILLERDPNLAFYYLTEEGDRALHVAAAMKHKDFVERLVERMSANDLLLVDGHGYTACCYAAISGEVEIARLMIEKNRSLVTTHDEKNVTPLHKAALRGDTEMLSYLLKSTKDEDLSKQEWFELLLVTIRGEMYDVAVEIMGKNGSIATMVNDEGTALHMLARQEISNANNFSIPWLVDSLFVDMTYDDDYGKDPPKVGELPVKLWAEMQKLEKGSLLELIRKPHLLLHDAAKAGNVELVTMLTHTHPQLIWDTDSNGYTLFHIAVIYRQPRVFNLIYQVEAMVGFRTLLLDQNDNTFLHLAAKLGPPNKKKLPPVLQMQNELLWFKKAEKIVPPSCVMMRNKDGLTPRELFSKEHRRLLKESETWMRNTADSCMLIATILLTVVFAAGFTMPGGYDDKEGRPILANKPWFKVFVIFEVLSLVGSVVSIVMFRSIMASRFAEEDFLSKLPMQQMFGFHTLLLSLIGAFSAYMAAVQLIEIKMRPLVWFSFISVYLFVLLWFFSESGAAYRDYKLKNSIGPSRHSLFDKNTEAASESRLTGWLPSCWLFCKKLAVQCWLFCKKLAVQ